MADPKPPRIPAGDLGTADRIEADDGHYWVRLVSKEAIRAEGMEMVNCLRHGHYDRLAGNDDPKKQSLWSLRDSGGRSIALADVCAYPLGSHMVNSFLGVQNTMASALAYRQLRHLASVYGAIGSGIYFARSIQEPAICAPDGMTYRWDKAPEDLRLTDHDERLARRLALQEERKRRQAAHEATLDNLAPPRVYPDAEAYVGVDFQPGIYFRAAATDDWAPMRGEMELTPRRRATGRPIVAFEEAFEFHVSRESYLRFASAIERMRKPAASEPVEAGAWVRRHLGAVQLTPVQQSIVDAMARVENQREAARQSRASLNKTSRLRPGLAPVR